MSRDHPAEFQWLKPNYGWIDKGSPLHQRKTCEQWRILLDPSGFKKGPWWLRKKYRKSKSHGRDWFSRANYSPLFHLHEVPGHTHSARHRKWLPWHPQNSESTSYAPISDPQHQTALRRNKENSSLFHPSTKEYKWLLVTLVLWVTDKSSTPKKRQEGERCG